MEIPASAKSYRAPWGWQVKLTTALVAAVLLAIPSLAAASFRHPSLSSDWFFLLPVLVLGGTALFAVRGYAVYAGKLVIQRPFWNTRYTLAELKTATLDPQGMSHSLRLFGNGGVFAFTGYFRNSKLGTYRAYVTDPKRCVVLHFTSQVVVISPDRPEEFVREAQAEIARSLGQDIAVGR